jgi:Kef-type K+ transport system membrane component KefB
MTEIMIDLGLLLVIATLLGTLARLLRQPVIIAYLLTGAIITYFNFFNLQEQEIFTLFSSLGIMFLLFLVGLEMNYSSIRLVGKTSLLVGLGQILFTFVFGSIIAFFLGFSFLTSTYIAITLTFSSTIIILKLLSDKNKLHSLYGRISVGFLLVQDIFVVILLIILGSQGHAIDIGFVLLKGIVLFGLVIIAGHYIISKLFSFLSRSTEILFLASLSWMFLLAWLAHLIGFSIEIAGFMAGLALANSAEKFHIASRIKVLRDFFILMFFAVLGSMLVMFDFTGLGLPIIVFSLFVLIGNPLIVLSIMGLLGYRKRTSFLAGVTVAQISEFSLILGVLGLRLGHINESIMALITAVGVITIITSTYMIINAEKIYPHISRWLSFFEKKNTGPDIIIGDSILRPIILIGCDRTGKGIVSRLPKDKITIIDSNPEICEKMKDNYHCLFGDIEDEQIREKAGFNQAEMIISTSPHLEDNIFLLTTVKGPKIIVRAERESDVEILYNQGAYYVLMPHISSGMYLGKMINEEKLEQLKEKDLSIFKNKL